MKHGNLTTIKGEECMKHGNLTSTKGEEVIIRNELRNKVR
jgi:hypothetical protein